MIGIFITICSQTNAHKYIRHYIGQKRFVCSSPELLPYLSKVLLSANQPLLKFPIFPLGPQLESTLQKRSSSLHRAKIASSEKLFSIKNF
jgi:hypothetical protein